MATTDDLTDDAEQIANFAVIGVILVVVWKIGSALGLIDAGGSSGGLFSDDVDTNQNGGFDVPGTNQW